MLMSAKIGTWSLGFSISLNSLQISTFLTFDFISLEEKIWSSLLPLFDVSQSLLL